MKILIFGIVLMITLGFLILPAMGDYEPLKSVLEQLRRSEDLSEKLEQLREAPNKNKSKVISNRKKDEMIDLYRQEVALQVQKNWAFNEQLAGGDHSLAAAIVFKVMPDGEIRDIFFTNRSGNAHLDNSVYQAIVKSSPIAHHPNGLAQPYVVVAIRFTPEKGN